MASILQPGHNCWRIEPASRASVLVDGAAYFAAFRAAAMRAEHSIFIIGWDVDSRVRLVRDGTEDDLPVELGALLNALVKRRRTLQIHVLDWDFAMLYAVHQELLPRYKPDWRTRRRLHFHLDDRHPVGGSHHQKIVVIDDALAFVYWLGPALGRDTVRHLAGRRINTLSRRLARHGLLAVLAVRMIPVAPFTVINLVAGASHIHFHDFVLGTLLGMTPGILAVTLFADRIAAVLRDPTPTALALLGAAVAVIVLGAWKLRNWLIRTGRRSG